MRLNPVQGVGKRVTFLVNWWAQEPKPPNCVPLTLSQVRQYQEKTGGMSSFHLTAEKPTESAIPAVTFDENSSTFKSKVVLPPQEPLYFT